MRSKWNVAAVVCIGFLFGLIVSQIIANVQIAQDFSIDERTCRHQEEAQAAQDWAARKDQKPSEDQQRTESQKNARDYCVQRRSAVAGERQTEFGRRALQLGWATLAAAVVAAFAAWKTVQAMRETARLENRAWLQIEEVKAVKGFRIDSDGFHLTASVTVKNVGETPARNVLISCKMIGVGGSIQTLPEDVATLRAASKAGYRSKGRATVFPDEIMPATEEEVKIDRARINAVSAVLPTPDNVVVPLILVAVTYGGVDGSGPHETGRIYFVDDIDIGKHHGGRDWSPSLKRTHVSDEWTT